MLVYTSIAANAVTVPTKNPTINNPGADNSVTPAPSVLTWDVYFDQADRSWHVRVTKMETKGTINIDPWPAAGTPNPVVGGGNVTEANHKTIIDDLEDYHTVGGGAGPVWHSTAASLAHEMFHWNTDWMVTSIGATWPGSEIAIENVSIPEGAHCLPAEARVVLQPLVDPLVATFWVNAVNIWTPIPDDPGVAGSGGYDAGAAVLNGIIDQIKELAKNPDGNGATDDAWGAPTGLGGNLAGGQVDLAWVDNCIVENGHVVERKEGAGAWGVVANLGAGAMAWTDGTVQVGKTYSYRVKATTSVDATAYSNTAVVNVP
jgi:hypothetical protein